MAPPGRLEHGEPSTAELPQLSAASFAMNKVILVVDDEPIIRSFIRDILEGSGYVVTEAADVHEALARLDAGGVAAVLTDIEMPGGLSGLDLARMIRAMWPSLVLILMSGRTLPLPHELPAFARMLTKPFSPETLIDMLRGTA
jgi:CheY-like chemotaxis protein